jgi:hypothetical protein
MAQWSCVAATMMFNSMTFAVDTVSHTGFDTTSWLPAMGWGLSGGDYSIVVHGDRFVMAETEKVKRFDELRRLLREAKRKRGGATARRAGQIADVRCEDDTCTWSSTEQPCTAPPLSPKPLHRSGRSHRPGDRAPWRPPAAGDRQPLRDKRVSGRGRVAVPTAWS